MSKRDLQLLVVIASLFLVTNCSGGKKQTGPLKDIRVAAYAGDTGALIYIADWQGCFVKNGVNVHIVDYAAGKLATDGLLRGEADISTATTSVFVSNSFNHPELRTFGTIAAAEINECIARKDRGIYRPGHLKGKRIGVTKKSTGEFYLGVLLLFNHLDLKDVKVIDLKPPEIVAAIKSGDIDAALTWDPNIYEIKKIMKEKVVSWPAQGGQKFYFILITQDSWLKTNPDAAKAFINALLEAEKFIKDNKEKAKNYVKSRFGYEADYINYSWLKHDFSVQLPQALLLAMEDTARWRIESDLTRADKIPNYLDYIYFDALEAVNPNAISVIR